MKNELPLSKEEFKYIYSKVPRLTVELLLVDTKKRIYLTLRDIEPCRGKWNLPGGTVHFGENLEQAVKRIAKREIGIEVLSTTMVGYIEYPSHYMHGLDHPVGLVFKIDKYAGAINLNKEAARGDWFYHLPKQIHADQDKFLVMNSYIN